MAEGQEADLLHAATTHIVGAFFPRHLPPDALEEQLGEVQRRDARRGRRAGCGRRTRRPARRRPARQRVRRAAGRARRRPRSSRSGRAPPRSCPPARSSRRPAAPSPRCWPAAPRRSPSPMTAWWWQCGWATTSTPVRSGGVHSPAATRSARNSASDWIPALTSAARGSSTSWPASSRIAARQLGSRPMTGTPLGDVPVQRLDGLRRRSGVRRSSWPVVIQVSPQHAGSGITAARRPLTPAAAIAARPVSAAKRSVNESAQIQTSTFSAQRRASLDAAGAREKRGRLRRWSTPAAALATRPTVLLRSIVLASFGGVIRRPARQLAERVVRTRPAQEAPRSGVLLEQGLGLVGRHVDAGRAVPRAALAGQAQVERLVDGRVVEVERRPLTTSWSTRARPRVESFSSRVARYDGHITPPDAGVVGDALADAGAAVDGPGERPGVVGEPQRRTHWALWRGEPEVGVERCRVDQHAGVEQVVGVEDAAWPAASGRSPAASTSAAAARSGPGRRRARRTSSRRTTPPGRRRSPRTRGTCPGRPASSSSKSIRTCTQPSPKWP